MDFKDGSDLNDAQKDIQNLLSDDEDTGSQSASDSEKGDKKPKDI